MAPGRRSLRTVFPSVESAWNRWRVRALRKQHCRGHQPGHSLRSGDLASTNWWSLRVRYTPRRSRHAASVVEHGITQDRRVVRAQRGDRRSHAGYRPPRCVGVRPLHRRDPVAAFEHREATPLQHLLGNTRHGDVVETSHRAPVLLRCVRRKNLEDLTDVKRWSLPPKNLMATSPPGLSTRWISSSASPQPPQMPFTDRTTSKRPSVHGSSNIDPTRRSALGVRSHATATSSAAASIPATSAPIPSATRTASPEPQATSRSEVPGPTPSLGSSATSMSIE